MTFPDPEINRPDSYFTDRIKYNFVSYSIYYLLITRRKAFFN